MNKCLRQKIFVATIRVVVENVKSLLIDFLYNCVSIDLFTILKHRPYVCLRKSPRVRFVGKSASRIFAATEM